MSFVVVLPSELLRGESRIEWRSHKARVAKVIVIPFLKYTAFLSCVLVRDFDILQQSAENTSNIYSNIMETPNRQLVYQLFWGFGLAV